MEANHWANTMEPRIKLIRSNGPPRASKSRDGRDRRVGHSSPKVLLAKIAAAEGREEWEIWSTSFGTKSVAVSDPKPSFTEKRRKIRDIVSEFSHGVRTLRGLRETDGSLAVGVLWRPLQSVTPFPRQWIGW